MADVSYSLVVERDRFEKMKEEFYNLRGWDVATGLPTETNLKALDLADISEAMKEVESAGIV